MWDDEIYAKSRRYGFTPVVSRSLTSIRVFYRRHSAAGFRLLTKRRATSRAGADRARRQLGKLGAHIIQQLALAVEGAASGERRQSRSQSDLSQGSKRTIVDKLISGYDLYAGLRQPCECRLPSGSASGTNRIGEYDY